MNRDDYYGYANRLMPYAGAARMSETLEQDARRYSRYLGRESEVSRR